MSRSLVLFAVAACTADPPGVAFLDLADPRCEGTRVERSCLTLRVRITADAADHAPGDLFGEVQWAVYLGGQVDLFGPGDHRPTHEGRIPDADLASGAFVEATIADVEARDYQTLAFLDDDGSGINDSGDPTTLPSDAFDVEPERHVLVHVVLDVVR